MSAHFGPDKKELVNKLTTVKEEPEVPAISANKITFFQPEEVHKFEIVKKNAQIGTNLKPDLKAIAKTNTIKQSKAQISAKQQEALLRAKNIGSLNKWQEFRVQRDLAIKAYVEAAHKARRTKVTAKKIITFQKVHYAYKCLLEGMRQNKYARHLVEYGQWAAFKMQIKLMRGLTKQFGHRLSLEQRIHKRTQFALSL